MLQQEENEQVTCGPIAVAASQSGSAERAESVSSHYDDLVSVRSGGEEWLEAEESREQRRTRCDSNSEGTRIAQMMHDVTGVLKEVVSELKSIKNKQDELAFSHSGMQSTPRGGHMETGCTNDHGGEPNLGSALQQNLRATAPEFRCRPSRNVHTHPDENNSYGQMHIQTQWQEPSYNGSSGGDCGQRAAVRRFDERRRPDGRVPGQHNVKIPPFTGREDWSVWLAKFEAIAQRQTWDENDMLDVLLPLIEGQASEFVFAQLPKETLRDYHDLTAELTRRYRVIETSRSFAAKFSQRNQRHGETAEDYAADLKRLYDRAHGHRDRRTRDEDLVRKFLDGLIDQETKFAVEYHKEPKDIDEAVFHVVNLIQTRNACRERHNKFHARRTTEDSDMHEDFCKGGGYNVRRVPAEKQKNNGRDRPPHRETGTKRAYNESNTTDLLDQIMQRLERLEKNNIGQTPDRTDKPNKRVECFYCHDMGHYARECPKKAQRQVSKTERANGEELVSSKAPLNSQGPSLTPGGRSN